MELFRKNDQFIEKNKDDKLPLTKSQEYNENNAKESHLTCFSCHGHYNEKQNLLWNADYKDVGLL